jgi:hypothetical protein
VNEPSPECLQGYEDKIRRLELETRPLDPGPKERALLTDKVVTYADSFIEHMDGKLAFAVSEGEHGALYDSPISEESTDPDEVLNLLDRGVIQSGVNVGSGATWPTSRVATSTLRPWPTTLPRSPIDTPVCTSPRPGQSVWSAYS